MSRPPHPTPGGDGPAPCSPLPPLLARAELMMGLTITQFEAELEWLAEVEAKIVRGET
ncbi:MAG: hypothetical protein IIB90_15340 [Gemmatimonadetes bacterium]|nr:hypothetical protein [Gemmatimonadota bacterium]